MRESIDDMGQLSFTGTVAAWSARRRWWVLGLSVAIIVLAMFVLNSVEVKLFDGDGGEGESALGADLVDQHFDLDTIGTEQLVFSHLSLDANDPAFRSAVDSLVEQLRVLPEVESVVSYYDTNSPEMISQNGRVVLASVEVSGNQEENISAVLEVVDAAAESTTGFEIGIAGQASIFHRANELMESDFGRVLMVTLVLGLFILLLAFRAVVAAIIPLLLAISAIICANAIAALLSQSYPLVDIYTEMILLMGMAVGIDYSLFIISRFRSERKAGRSKMAAIAVASNTTGRAVLYAGVTVVLSLAGLIMTNNPIFISLSMAAIIVVLLAIVGSLTLLPALLGILGDNINRLRVPFLGRDGLNNGNGSIWSAITDRVLARPAVLATLTAGFLIAAAVPVGFLNLGFNSGSDALPDANESKRTLELLEEHFTAGLSQPAYVVVDAANAGSPSVQAAVANLIGRLEQDSSFFGPFHTMTSETGEVLFIAVPLVGNIDDQVSIDAINHLRQDVIPAAFAGSAAQVYVTGMTAASMDFKNHMYERAPYVFGFVLGLAFIILLVMFRSVVIPAKAIVLNLLSAGAAYGVLVIVFQFGWGISLLGAEATGVIEAWLPLFLFGILFGLSMDYHMLVLNRIKEAHDQGHSNEDSVSQGIKVTAGQITSAAAIMVGVFGAFALANDVGMKQFGVGLGVAVLIDATLIRSVLLPASMKLLGDRNWYLPGWLKWLPEVKSEAETPVGQSVVATVAVGGDD